jgi:hypothetical protein
VSKTLLSLAPAVRAKLDTLPPGEMSARVSAVLLAHLPELDAVDVTPRADVLTRERAEALVAEHGTQAAAARAIGVAESTIGRALKRSGMARCPSRHHNYECALSAGHAGLHDSGGGFTRWTDGADTRTTIDVSAPPEIPTTARPRTR